MSRASWRFSSVQHSCFFLLSSLFTSSFPFTYHLPLIALLYLDEAEKGLYLQRTPKKDIDREPDTQTKLYLSVGLRFPPAGLHLPIWELRVVVILTNYCTDCTCIVTIHHARTVCEPLHVQKHSTYMMLLDIFSPFSSLSWSSPETSIYACIHVFRAYNILLRLPFWWWRDWIIAGWQDPIQW